MIVRTVQTRGKLRGTWLLAGLIGVALAGTAWGAPIEIDGNVIDDPGDGADWCEIVYGAPGCVILFSGVVPDLPPRTIFTGGGSKDIQDISSWEWKDGSVPNKDDIRNAMVALAIDPDTGHRFIAFAADRHANNGSAQIGFWLFQDEVCRIGETSGTFAGQHVDGDLLVLAEYEVGGTEPDLKVYKWEAGWPDPPNLRPLGETPQPGLEADTNHILLGPADTCFAPDVWEFKPKHGDDNTYPEMSWFEGSVDLDMYLPEVICFSTFVIETRSSHEPNATLKDFVCGSFDTCADISGKKEEVQSVIGDDPPSCDNVIGSLADWEIRLLDANGDLVTEDALGQPLENPTCTEADGSYEFRNLLNGQEFTVCEVVPDWQPDQNYTWLPCLPPDGTVGDSVSPGSCPTGEGTEFCHPMFTLDVDATGMDFRNFKQLITTEFNIISNELF